MKAQNNFIKKLSAYLDQEFDDFSVRRIMSFLDEYEEERPPKIIKVSKDSKQEFSLIQLLDKIKKNAIKDEREIITDEQLQSHARQHCINLGLDYDLFMKARW